MQHIIKVLSYYKTTHYYHPRAPNGLVDDADKAWHFDTKEEAQFVVDHTGWALITHIEVLPS